MLPGKKIKNTLAAATKNPTAHDCLLLIEEPAIPVIEKMLKELGSAGEALLADLRVAKSTREIRHPGSTWYGGGSSK